MSTLLTPQPNVKPAVQPSALRATEFRRACRRAGVEGVSLHCYRYAWAERAKSCGYPEGFAQVALGHNRRAVHESYASGASPVLPAHRLAPKQHHGLRRPNLTGFLRVEAAPDGTNAFIAHGQSVG